MRAPKEQFDFVHEFLNRVFIDDLHAKRVVSLANGALGVITGAVLAVSLIGQALAKARALIAKSAIKQVDRLLSNAGVVPWDTCSVRGFARSWDRGVRSSWRWTGPISTPTINPSALRIFDPQRRDRLLLNAFAILLFTLLGAAGESLGMDRQLRTSTVKRRVHSLFRQKLPALRPHPQHARIAAAAPHPTISRIPKPEQNLLRDFRTSREMGGYRDAEKPRKLQTKMPQTENQLFG